MLEYTINPVQMGGLVKEVAPEGVKIHLHGRLGVLTVPYSLVPAPDPEPGLELRFWFSYLRVREKPYDYDAAPLREPGEIFPTLVGAVLTEVNDTAILARIQDNLGTVAVPRRWVFTDVPLAVGQTAEFYLSPMEIVGKREIPASFI